MSDARAPAPAPVTVLTGFLGAGKTTLLNRLLRDPALAGAAVLVNEFGEIGIDHLLIEKLDEDTVLLPSGCLCCSLRGDLVRALENLEARAPSRVVVETTGLADPVPLVQTLMSHPLLVARWRLDGIVTVISAMHGVAQMEAHPTALRQAAIADRIVVSKSDLADPAPLLTRLAELNPAAQTRIARHGEIPAAALLDLGLFTARGKHADVVAWLAESALSRHIPQGRIQSFCLTWDEPLPWQGIGTCLEMMIGTQGERMLRVKGILNLIGQERPLAIHGVQHVFHEPVLLDAWPPGDDRRSRLVFITDGLDRSIVEQGFAAFIDAARTLA
ncbi:MAG: GTP-binding protein [Rhodospirillales bacterium]|nr:GTP-binding protein [Rhodospirillales bacterium]